ncbi:unnamed protein product (mitochondrion) [Plasmodiophora brassicae]|uniref:Uncharacterized protein n=1 Tax=Plasmodiophora brassicae TaxID=37360 RepID=A0A0G4J0S2_PLABS|nr:hypothetical protein PBRA_008457 [Plasmodiophora brassicae]SPR01601.1 unnamed protein product [Plasmodiophora brassicae]
MRVIASPALRLSIAKVVLTTAVSVLGVTLIAVGVTVSMQPSTEQQQQQQRPLGAVHDGHRLPVPVAETIAQASAIALGGGALALYAHRSRPRHRPTILESPYLSKEYVVPAGVGLGAVVLTAAGVHRYRRRYTPQQNQPPPPSPTRQQARRYQRRAYPSPSPFVPPSRVDTPVPDDDEDPVPDAPGGPASNGANRGTSARGRAGANDNGHQPSSTSSTHRRASRPSSNARGSRSHSSRPRSHANGPEPGSNGPQPDSNGSTSDSNGFTPESNGSTPESNGSTPESNGSAPDRDGSELEGSPLELKLAEYKTRVTKGITLPHLEALMDAGERDRIPVKALAQTISAQWEALHPKLEERLNLVADNNRFMPVTADDVKKGDDNVKKLRRRCLLVLHSDKTTGQHLGHQMLRRGLMECIIASWDEYSASKASSASENPVDAVIQTAVNFAHAAKETFTNKAGQAFTKGVRNLRKSWFGNKRKSRRASGATTVAGNDSANMRAIVYRPGDDTEQ